MIFSVARIVNYNWDHESVYGETIECEVMICEREMSVAGGGCEESEESAKNSSLWKHKVGLQLCYFMQPA